MIIYWRINVSQSFIMLNIYIYDSIVLLRDLNLKIDKESRMIYIWNLNIIKEIIFARENQFYIETIIYYFRFLLLYDFYLRLNKLYMRNIRFDHFRGNKY